MTARKELTLEDLEQGGTFRGKRPRRNLLGEYDDRTILYVGSETVQYDSIAVRQGRRYPSVSIDRFLKWASHQIDTEGIE